MHYSSVEKLNPAGNLIDMKKAEGIFCGFETAMETVLKYLRYLPLVVLGILLVTSGISYYRTIRAVANRPAAVTQRSLESIIIVTHTVKMGETTQVIALEDIVSRDMVPVEIRFNKPDSPTELGEWQKVVGGVQFPYPVTYVQYRALTDTFSVRVRTPRTRS
jgi:hypothetical protein